MAFEVYSPVFARRFTVGSSTNLLSTTVPTLAYPFSFGCWFLDDDAASVYTVMSISDSGTTNNEFVIQLRGADTSDPISLRVRAGGAFADASVLNYLTAGKWIHVIGVIRSATDRQIYVDGDNTATNTTSRDPLALIDRVGIGVSADSTPSSHHNGLIAWPAIWNAELGIDEIIALSRGAYPLNVQRHNLAAFWDWTGGYERSFDGQHALTNSGTVPINCDHTLFGRRISRNYLAAGYTAAPPAGTKRKRMLLLGVGS